jgi:OOP family OmpA-OmpF porin
MVERKLEEALSLVKDRDTILKIVMIFFFTIFKKGNKMKKLLLASIVASASLFATTPGIELLYQQTKVDGDYKLGTSGSSVDVRDDLGMTGKSVNLKPKIYTWLNDDNKIDFSAEMLQWNANNTINKTIAGQNFNSAVKSNLDVDTFQFGYGYKVAGDDKSNLLFGTDLNIFSASQTIASATQGLSAKSSKTSLVPTLKLEGKYDLDGFGVEGKVAGMTYGDKGNFLEYAAGIFFGCPVIDDLSWRVGYRVKDFQDIDLDSFNGDMKFSGIYAGFNYPFGKVEKAPIVPVAKPVTVEKPQDGDNDGIINSVDRCPNSPAGVTVNSNGCEIDSDNDGVVNSSDKCPRSVAGAIVNAQGCEVDSDGDGYVDSNDKCPNSPAGAKVDNNGCTVNVTLKVQFDTNSDVVKEQYFDEIQAVANAIKSSNTKIVVEGHTDSRGSAKYNKSLSLKRAISVAKKIISYGVKGSNVTAIGYGEERPVASNMIKEGRAQNRRIAVKVVK